MFSHGRGRQFEPAIAHPIKTPFDDGVYSFEKKVRLVKLSQIYPNITKNWIQIIGYRIYRLYLFHNSYTGLMADILVMFPN